MQAYAHLHSPPNKKCRTSVHKGTNKIFKSKSTLHTVPLEDVLLNLSPVCLSEIVKPLFYLTCTLPPLSTFASF